MRTFEARNGSTLCLELLGCDISTPAGLAQARQKELFRSRCSKLVRDAVEIVEGMPNCCSAGSGDVNQGEGQSTCVGG